MSQPSTLRPKPKLAISACLLGDEVRFNGGHKRSHRCQDLEQYFEFVRVCPEVAIGLGTPREAIRLVGDPARPRAKNSSDQTHDYTDALAKYGKRMADELEDICGYILMQKSPSCGLERVKVYQDDGLPAETNGQGIYTHEIQVQRPNLPLEEDGRLNDPVLRENFITRVYAYHEWQTLLASGLSHRALLAYHARYKYQLMAHNPEQYRELGRLLGSQLTGEQLVNVATLYFSRLMHALKRCATRGTHTNVLQHLSGYLKRVLDADEREEMQDVIAQYREGIVPLIVPMTLLKHHFRRHPDPYVANQAYLQPHPEPLSLRNAI
ncbi:YbgA family protein [Pseudomonas matsuisoli]|uniref:DUF1722 domain-containing protein n=1 Tax=Pseudomonas matsuisoli TaxID=1515666 RepID=A0A917Q1S2_9PSED|nr:DUF523 and DUF1722 domain-containing protein [Pseudomonas matsuisoli]GGK07474.1 hypothetical protein GCM10009304_37110 [Pseudomonas matsuisoli]